jgi:geranylgeranyl pyrophosphate synthase
LQDEPSHLLLSRITTDERSENGSVEEAVQAIRASGAIERSMEEARRFASLAQDALEILPESAYRSEMHALADFAVNRNL